MREARPVVPHPEWVAARRALLAAEKDLLRQQDEVTRQRQQLPWEAVREDYVFARPDGSAVRLAELFDGKSELVVYHFMSVPEWNQPHCGTCSMWVDGFNGLLPHLRARMSLAVVSKAPPVSLAELVQRKGWQVPLLSSASNSFNSDFKVEALPSVEASGEGASAEDDGIHYNYAPQGNQVGFSCSQMPGCSVFHKTADGTVVHTYSTYARGLEQLCSTYKLLDLLPWGRESFWPKHKDEYDQQPAAAAST